MREDQRKRLADVCERLADVVIRDADPDNWHSLEQIEEGRTDLPLGQMTALERGNAVWNRKAAAQSVALLVRMEGLLKVDGEVPPGDPDPEADIKRAERAAAAVMARCAKQRD